MSPPKLMLLHPDDNVLVCIAPIGSATQAIEAGEWVHVHNMKSDYIRTHDRHTVAGDAA